MRVHHRQAENAPMIMLVQRQYDDGVRRWWARRWRAQQWLEHAKWWFCDAQAWQLAWQQRRDHVPRMTNSWTHLLAHSIELILHVHLQIDQHKHLKIISATFRKILLYCDLLYLNWLQWERVERFSLQLEQLLGHHEGWARDGYSLDGLLPMQRKQTKQSTEKFEIEKFEHKLEFNSNQSHEFVWHKHSHMCENHFFCSLLNLVLSLFFFFC